MPGKVLPTFSSLRRIADSEADVRKVLADPTDDSFVSWFERRFFDEEEERLHLLVPRRSGIRPTKRLVFHQACLALPPGSLLELSPKVSVCSPELLFVQMASVLEMGELVALGYELCGCYPMGDGSLKVRRQLTTPSRLRAFVQRVKGMNGIGKARIAAKYIQGKSASVMETEVSALATMPVKWGGYGLPPARLNEPVLLTASASKIARSGYLAIDLYWPDEKVALEFDGREGHDSELDRVRDSRRRDALTAQGIDLSTITYRQFSSLNEFDEIMMHVACSLGKRIRVNVAAGAAHGRLRQQLRSFHRGVHSPSRILS